MFDLNKAENKARNSSHLNAERRVVRGVFFGFERLGMKAAQSIRAGLGGRSRLGVRFDVEVPPLTRWMVGTEIEEEAT